MFSCRSGVFKHVLYPLSTALMAVFFFACANGTSFSLLREQEAPLQYDYAPFLMKEGFKGEHPFIGARKERPDRDPKEYANICKNRLEEIAGGQGPESPEMGYMLIAYSAVCAEMSNRKEMEVRQNQFLAIFEKLLGTENPDMAHYWHLAGANYRETAELDKMMECYKKVCSLSESRKEYIEPSYVEDIVTLGDALILHGRFEEALKYYKKVLISQVKTLGPKSREVARTCCILGDAYIHLADYESAEHCFWKALEIENEKYIAKDQISVRAKLGLTVVMMHQKKMKSADFHFVWARSNLENESPEWKAAYVNYALNNISPRFLTRAEIFQKGYMAALNLLPNNDNRFYAANLYKLGVLQVRLGDFKEAEKNLAESVRIYEKHLGGNNIHACTAMLELARLYIATNNPVPAEKLLDQAAILQSQNPKVEPRLQGEILLEKAHLESRQAKHSEAVNSYEKSLGVLESLFGPDKAPTALVKTSIAWQHISEGKYQEARPILENALEICTRELGRKSIFTCYMATHMAHLIMAEGDTDKAMDMLEKVVEIEKNKQKRKAPNYGDTLIIVAIGHMELGEYELAEEKALQALQILEYNFGEYNVLVGDAQALLADIYCAAGRLQKAKDCQEKALAIYEIAIPHGHYIIGDAFNSLGIIQTRTTGYENAITSFKKAQTVMEDFFGPGHPETGIIYKNMAICYKTMGEDDLAKSCFDKAAAIQGEAEPSGPPVFTSGLGKFWRNWARE